MKHKRCNTGVDIVVEVQSKVEVFPDHQWTDVTCVIGHGDGDLCKLTSLGCILSSSTSLLTVKIGTNRSDRSKRSPSQIRIFIDLDL